MTRQSGGLQGPLDDGAPDYSEMSQAEQRLARMLFFSLWSDGGGFASVEDGLDAFRRESATRAEISTVVDLSYEARATFRSDLPPALADVPLKVHARYQREEILAALDFPRNPNSFREGVLYLEHLNVDAFFITLKKSEADYSPTTMYADYPISRDLFHWESQSTTSVDVEDWSAVPQRHEHGAPVCAPGAEGRLRYLAYLFLGPATYVNHTGDRPIAITWRLETQMPMDFFNHASAIAQ